MTTKERIKGVFGSHESQINFLQWLIAFGVGISSILSGLTFNRIEGMNSKYLEIKESSLEIKQDISNINNTVNKHTISIDSLEKRIGVLELCDEKIEKIKLIKRNNYGN